jgi:hypothetical protein
MELTIQISCFLELGCMYTFRWLIDVLLKNLCFSLHDDGGWNSVVE